MAQTETGELLPLITPGDLLKEEFMDPLDMTAYRVAKGTGMQQTRVEQILDGRRSITPDTAERLGRFFGMSMEFWLNLQNDYDLRKWRRECDEQVYATIKPYSEVAA